MYAVKRQWTKKQKGVTVFAVVVFVVGSILVPIFSHDIRNFFIHPKDNTAPIVAVAAPPTAAPTIPQAAQPASATADKSHNKVKGQSNVVGNNTPGNGNVIGNGNQTTQGPISVGGGSIVTSGGTVKNPTIINNPKPATPNPLDPYDGTLNSKVAADALAEAVRLENSVRTCQDGWAHAVQQDIDMHYVHDELLKVYVWQTKARLQEYAGDLTNLHKSLIYRLGVAERNAESDQQLKGLLDPDPNSSFTCWDFQTVGDYFYSLGTKLKAKGD
jgi:hypothetical protein